METKHTPEAEALADSILRASGSGLRHYTLQANRDAIIGAAQKGIDDSRAELLVALSELLNAFGTPEAAEDEAQVFKKARAAIAKATP